MFMDGNYVNALLVMVLDGMILATKKVDQSHVVLVTVQVKNDTNQSSNSHYKNHTHERG